MTGVCFCNVWRRAVLASAQTFFDALRALEKHQQQEDGHNIQTVGSTTTMIMDNSSSVAALGPPSAATVAKHIERVRPFHSFPVPVPAIYLSVL